MDLLIVFVIGALIGALFVILPIAWTARELGRVADRALTTRPVPTAAPIGEAQSAVDRPRENAAAPVVNGGGPARLERHLVNVDDNLDLFSDLVPSMGRTAANDPAYRKPCAPCERARAAMRRLLVPPGVRSTH